MSLNASPEITPLPRDLIARQATIVTQTVVASPSASATQAASGSSFPVAVAVPALIGGMALAILGAVGYWWYQRRRTRERKRRWESRQKRQNKKRAGSTGTSRPSLSGNRPTGGRSTEKEKELHSGPMSGSIPPVPPLPILNKEYGYGQPQSPPHSDPYNNHSYPGQVDQYGHPIPQQQYGQYNQYDQYGSQPHSVQPGIDNYGVAAKPTSDPFDTPTSEQQPDFAEEYKPNSPAALSAPKSSSRGAKRVELAENAAAREGADPNTRWRPNKPSPLAIAAEKKRLESQAAAAGRQPPALSPTRSTGGYGRRTSEGPSSPNGNWEYQEQLSTPNDPDFSSRRSEDVGQRIAGGGNKHVSGTWGVADGSPQPDNYYNRQSGNAGYANDPYLNRVAEGDEDQGRQQSGQYTLDPYAGYHGAAPAGSGTGAKGSGWV